MNKYTFHKTTVPLTWLQRFLNIFRWILGISRVTTAVHIEITVQEQKSLSTPRAEEHNDE
jgi:hypothetical protein